MIKSSYKFLIINKYFFIYTKQSEIERSYTEIQIPKYFRENWRPALNHPPDLKNPEVRCPN